MYFYGIKDKITRDSNPDPLKMGSKHRKLGDSIYIRITFRICLINTPVVNFINILLTYFSYLRNLHIYPLTVCVSSYLQKNNGLDTMFFFNLDLKID